MLGTFLHEEKGKTKHQNLRGEIVLIIDIRSSGIGAAIVKNFEAEGKAPLVLKTVRKRIIFENSIQSGEFISKSKITLKKVLEETLNKQNTFGKIEGVRVFYGSPWYKSNIKNIKKEENKKRNFDYSYLKKIIGEHKEDKENEDVLVLEKKMIGLKINGYETKKPVGKEFKEIELSFYKSMVHKETQKELTKIITDFIKTKDIKFNTHPYTIFKVLDKKFESEDNYTIFDISGEITEIIVFRGGNFEKIISIPHGINYFVRDLSKKLQSGSNEIVSRIDDLTNTNHPDQETDSYKNAFIDTKRDWLDSVKKIMNDNGIKSIPCRVFVLMDKEFKNLSLNILNDPEAYVSVFKFGRKPDITLLDSDSVLNLVRYKESVEKDPFLALEAGFVEETE